MDLERARESLRAAALCLREGCANAAANRAYYAMFQAAQVALEHAGLGQQKAVAFVAAVEEVTSHGTTS